MWFLKSITLVIGALIAVAIAFIAVIGQAFDIQEIRADVSLWGLKGLELWLIFLAIALLTVIIQLAIKANRLERVRPNISVTPKSVAGKDIELIVHNKGNAPATFEAVMTCTSIFNALMQTKISPLMNASMGWETSGAAEETINADGEKTLKVCRSAEKSEDGALVHYMSFYKVVSNGLQEVEFGHYVKDTQLPKVKIDIEFFSNLPINGQRKWSYEINYIVPTPFLGIKPIGNTEASAAPTVGSSNNQYKDITDA